MMVSRKTHLEMRVRLAKIFEEFKYLQSTIQKLDSIKII